MTAIGEICVWLCVLSWIFVGGRPLSTEGGWGRVEERTIFPSPLINIQPPIRVRLSRLFVEDALSDERDLCLAMCTYLGSCGGSLFQYRGEGGGGGVRRENFSPLPLTNLYPQILVKVSVVKIFRGRREI